MTLIAFVAVCATAGCLALLARESEPPGRVASLAGFAVAFAIALFIRDGQSASVGDVKLMAGTYSGFFLACLSGSALLLFLVGLGTGWPGRLAPAALAAFACMAVAITATNALVALTAGALAVTAGSVAIMIAGPADEAAAASGVTTEQTGGRVAEMRIVALVAGALLLAAVAILRPAWNSSSDAPVFVLTFLALGLALAVRSGAVPFHGTAARLRKTAIPMAPALLLVWLPAGLGILALSWSATTFKIHGGSIDAAVAAVQAVAIATLLLGAVGALLSNELDEIAAYSILGDAAFVLLALAARSDAAGEPARLWLLVFVAAKTGLVAWAAAVGRAYASSHLDELNGWMRRTPLLGLALVAITVATLGWPGSSVYEARASLVRLALPGQLGLLTVAAALLMLAYVGRLLVVGALPMSDAVRAGASEWPQRPHGGQPEAEALAQATTPAEAIAANAASSAVAEQEPAAVPLAIVEPPKRKRRSRAAAAAEPLPVVSVPVPDGIAPAVEEPTATEAVPEAPSKPALTTPGVPARLTRVWHLNRTLEVSVVVVGAALMTAALAVGSFGAGNAARSGVPLDIPAHATPTPTPPPTLAPIPTGPAPSGSPTSEPSESAGLTPSPSPTPLASPTPSPVKTLPPAQNPGD